MQEGKKENAEPSKAGARKKTYRAVGERTEKMYKDYVAQMMNDVRTWIDENIDLNEFDTVEEMTTAAYDGMWIDDSITGNASGSYYFNSFKAREMVFENMDIVTEALEAFGTPAEEIARKFMSEDWEYFDVTARCYLLGQVLDEVAEDYREIIDELREIREEAEEIEAAA